MRIITIKDIAKKLGVSHSTVSRSVNNDPRISEKTREAVLRAVKEMKYMPNTAARSLARAKSNTIAVVTFSYFLPFPVELIRGIEESVIRAGYELVYYTTSRYTYMGTEGRDAFIYEKILNEKKADVVIVFSGMLYGGRNIIGRYKKAGVQLVFVEGKDKWGHRVHYDNYAAAEIAVSHFSAQNRKKTGMIIGNTVDVQSFSERKAGFLRAMAKTGQKQADRNIFEFSEMTPRLANEALEFFMKNGIDSVYTACGDTQAVDLLIEAAKKGIRVPEDIAIIGQDDIPIARAAGLTTVRQPIRDMGKKAVEIAVEAIRNKNIKMKDVLFAPELIKRNTA
ncbi:MAG TPA: LacI family DNA-binding transcriptional regulator [Candidatus Goldiibacteriota bacterium]|nr:LacI family DNA-binding transcriptional regulator [Candidatus Goldiibacteriota bacterium]